MKQHVLTVRVHIPPSQLQFSVLRKSSASFRGVNWRSAVGHCECCREAHMETDTFFNHSPANTLQARRFSRTTDRKSWRIKTRCCSSSGLARTAAIIRCLLDNHGSETSCVPRTQGPVRAINFNTFFLHLRQVRSQAGMGTSLQKKCIEFPPSAPSFLGW